MLYPTQRSAEEWREIAAIVTANLVYNEERGREAAGVAVIQADGHCYTFKQPVPVSELVEMEGYRRALSAIGDDTVCVLGHTRMPTKGSRWRNVNNHPLVAEHVVGVHNGIIVNDDHIFAHAGLPRAGEVDSEVIFRLQDTVNPLQCNGRYAALVQERMSLLEGTFATLSVDLRRPAGLLVLKQFQPLCLHYEQEWQALFFSSRYAFLRQAFGRSVITEALESGRGFYFDAQRLPQNGNRPVFSFDIVEARQPQEQLGNLDAETCFGFAEASSGRQRRQRVGASILPAEKQLGNLDAETCCGFAEASSGRQRRQLVGASILPTEK